MSSLFSLFFFVKLMGEKVQRYENRQNELKRQMEDLVNNNEKLYKEQDKLFWEMLDKINKIQREQVLTVSHEKYLRKIDNV